jgi:glucokinase
MFESRDPTVAQAPAYPRLLGDIGGTNARFGWQTADDAPITHVQVLMLLNGSSATHSPLCTQSLHA